MLSSFADGNGRPRADGLKGIEIALDKSIFAGINCLENADDLVLPTNRNRQHCLWITANQPHQRLRATAAALLAAQPDGPSGCPYFAGYAGVGRNAPLATVQVAIMTGGDNRELALLVLEQGHQFGPQHIPGRIERLVVDLLQVKRRRDHLADAIHL